MALVPGDRIGIYEVRDLIGAGGMGEVYRGHDPKLNRSVALKILPDGFAADPDRLARFKREAQVLASLNHSNIASIFGLEDSGAVHALVLEYVEGPTLADRIAQGPLSVDEALPVGRQIADALETAHAQGIVHRDLKPANIKVRADGTVKVLDFGLAKALSTDVATSAVTQSPTMTSPALTQMGIILGTAAYMSPEQARGRPADKRSDIWAFGVVLYEMLAGKRAFDGDDMSYTLANILKSEPDWNALAPGTPPAVRRVLRRCLEKDPRRRVHDIADARLELDEKDEVVAPAPPPVATRTILGVERVGWLLIVAALAGLLVYTLRKEPPATATVRFQIGPPENAFFGSASGIGRAEGSSGAAVSPDGTQLTFIATEKPARTQLWLRRLDTFTSRPLPGTDDALMPFWSPDSRSIGFFAAGQLKRIDLADGTVSTVADAARIPRGGTWGTSDVIVFSAGTPPSIARVPARGGEVTPIASEVIFARWPSFLPDGRHFLLTGRLPSDTRMGVIVASIEQGFQARLLVQSDGNAAFAPPGALLFIRDDRILQHAFDPDRFEVSGDAMPVADQVLFNPGVGRADFSVSTNGVLVFRPGSSRSNQFAWFDRAGAMLETVGPPGNYRTPDLSPDGQKLVYGDVNQGDIWIFDLVRHTSSRFTSGPGTETAPVWFPDGNRIAYRKDQGGLFEKDVTGTGTERVLLKDSVNGPDQISPDGKWLLYFAVTAGPSAQDVYVLPLVGEPKPQAIVQTPFADVEPQFSPDMRWLAYSSTENERNELYVQPFPATGRRWQISNAGGRQPLWRADGKELFFVSDDRRFYAVSISEKTGVLEYGTLQLLFEMRANVFNSRNSYVPSRDGQRFLVNMLLDADDAPINVVQSWQRLLDRP
jgi:Tol biopolymer transport system component